MSRMIQTNVIQQKSQPSLFQKLGGKLIDAGTNYLTDGLSGMLGLNPGSSIMGGGGGDSGSSVIQGASGSWNQAKLGDQLMADQQKNILTPEKNMFALPSDTGQPNSVGGSSQGYGGGSGSTQGAEAPGAPYGASELADQSNAGTESMIAELEKDPNNKELVAYLRSNPQYAAALLKSRGGH